MFHLLPVCCYLCSEVMQLIPPVIKFVRETDVDCRQDGQVLISMWVKPCFC